AQTPGVLFRAGTSNLEFATGDAKSSVVIHLAGESRVVFAVVTTNRDHGKRRTASPPKSPQWNTEDLSGGVPGCRVDRSHCHDDQSTITEDIEGGRQHRSP